MRWCTDQSSDKAHCKCQNAPAPFEQWELSHSHCLTVRRSTHAEVHSPGRVEGRWLGLECDESCQQSATGTLFSLIDRIIYAASDSPAPKRSVVPARYLIALSLVRPAVVIPCGGVSDGVLRMFSRVGAPVEEWEGVDLPCQIRKDM